MRPRWADLRRASRGDAVIGLAGLTLLAALLYPTFTATRFRGLVADTVDEIETLRSGAQGIFSRSGSWPPAEAVGGIPLGLAGAFPGDSTLTRQDYTLQWSLLDIVEQVEAPRSAEELVADAPPDSVGPTFVSSVRGVGRIVVHSGRSELLAELLHHFGAAVSFVRDTTWTLVVTEPEEG